MPFITVLQSTENARAEGEFKGLILASTVWYKIFAAGAFVEDLVIRQQEDGTEAVEFREGPTKTQSSGLTIRRRTTPQIMYGTNGGKTDPVRLFKLWLSKRPEGMKDTGPLYLSVISRPQSADVWNGKVRMGQNTIGNIMKSMASCLKTNKKLTNHSMRKTLVSKLKKSGLLRNVIL